MQNVLRHCNSIGSKEGIIYFCDVLCANKNIAINELRDICALNNEIRLNFEASVAFFDYLDLIQVEHYSNTINAFELHKLLANSDKETALCECCLNKCLSSKKIDVNTIRFDANAKKYYMSKYSFGVSDAVFRNYLIAFNALNEEGSRLYINDYYSSIFSTVRKRINREITLEQLKEKLQREEEQGALAESYVLQLEKHKLKNKVLISQIKQISVLDVTAGYDIASFLDDNSTEYDLFIEVKSYVGNLHFYWSANEIEVAKILKEKYVIALVDIDRINQDTYRPIYIVDPQKVITEDSTWIMNASSYLVTRCDD